MYISLVCRPQRECRCDCSFPLNSRGGACRVVVMAASVSRAVRSYDVRVARDRKHSLKVERWPTRSFVWRGVASLHICIHTCQCWCVQLFRNLLDMTEAGYAARYFVARPTVVCFVWLLSPTTCARSSTIPLSHLSLHVTGWITSYLSFAARTTVSFTL